MRRVFGAWLLFAAVLFACGGADTPPGPYPQVCNPDDPDPLGPVCVQSVGSDAEFDRVSLEDHSFRFAERITKYMVPADDDRDAEWIPPLIQNANRFRLHLDFLKAVFFPGMTATEYMDKVLLRASRRYYSGNFVRFNDPVEGTFYGFTAYTATSSAELLEPVEVRAILALLSGIFEAGELRFTFEPFDAMGPAKAKTWVEPGFPIYFPNHDAVKVEVYTPAVNYGRMRLYTLAEFEAAALEGLLSPEDLLVIDQVPFDVESVVAGVITGGRQWELSHVNVRMARRGTPNLFIQDPLETLEEYDGQLVRLEAVKGATGLGSDSYTIAAATEGEAAAWWSAHRPHLDNVPAVDPEYAALDRLTEMDTDDDPVPLVSRFGGKASNLARLYGFMEGRYQVPAFGIPFSHFEDFLALNTIHDRRAGDEVIPLKEYVRRLAADPRLRSDAAYRRGVLWDLRSHIRFGGVLPAGLEAQLIERIRQVVGGTGVKVKFRSSSNIEDSLEFSGAGLYSSTAVCADDDLDGDLSGPSACDPDQGEEHTVRDGLLTVWASLFNDRAWDEREWYQVPQDAAGMAILVNLAFPDEKANGVAFTGQPSDATDHRYLINAQVGDEKVVGNDPHLIPEKDLLTLEDGEVSRIQRARSSALVAPGETVLSDDELKELGRLMAVIDAAYPLDLEGHAREEVLLDLEFKVNQNGELKVKQIRPFLMGATGEQP